MSEKILCPNCSSKISKSYLSRHKLTEKCKSQTQIVLKNNTGIDYISDLPDDVLKKIFLLVQKSIPKYGINCFITIRQVCKSFNNIVTELGSDLLNQHNLKIITSRKYHLLYITSINRYIGTQKCIDNYRITKKMLSEFPKEILNRGICGITHLYKKPDIIVKSLQLYGETLDSVIEKRNEKLEKMAEKRAIKDKERFAKIQREQNERRNELKDIMSKCGLTVRSDSALCQNYIEGSDYAWSLREIVNRMANMKYLFEYCKFEKVRNSLKRQGMYYGFDDCEEEVLSRHGGDYPKIYPWLKQSIDDIIGKESDSESDIESDSD